MLFRVCIECDHANPPDSRFCGKCGAPLQVRFCRLCRSPNDALSRYCQSCGTALPELAEPEAAPMTNEGGSATFTPPMIAPVVRSLADASAAPPASKAVISGLSPSDEAGAIAGGAGEQLPSIDGLSPRPARSTMTKDGGASAIPSSAADTTLRTRTQWAQWAAVCLAAAAVAAALGAFA